MRVITTEKKPIKMWLDTIEDGALQQARDLANLPFTFKWISIMPDSHQGYGMPIGGVLATKGVVIPNAVGVDIGCGMCAMKTSLKEISTKNLVSIMALIRERIPVGFNHRKDPIKWDEFDNAPQIPIVQNEINSAKKQLGTLGGGNHFIEIQKGSDDHIWIMVHSGSRNFGLKIAKEFHQIAVKKCEMYHSNLPNKDLSFLPINTKDASNYFDAMNFALEFAKENRRIMLDNIMDSFTDIVECSFDDVINIHHNYAAWENHYGANVIVHRKGATSARQGQLGIIPGSQGTKSYIVKGKGNKESFMSCSHGAGRVMGRKEAQRKLSLEDEKNKLDSQGVLHSIRNTDDLDEASGAYKNITVVMENQKDLVDIECELSPLGVIKG
jgi:tRNA-splicing ligase RtcB